MKTWSRAILLLIALGVAGVATWCLCGKELEAWYHLSELRRLAERELVISQNGFAMDESFDKMANHRDRLECLGVFFGKTYPLGELNRDQRRRVVETLELNFPMNHYWELSHGDRLRVWDEPSRQSEWDSVVAAMQREIAAD